MMAERMERVVKPFWVGLLGIAAKSLKSDSAIMLPRHEEGPVYTSEIYRQRVETVHNIARELRKKETIVESLCI